MRRALLVVGGAGGVLVLAVLGLLMLLLATAPGHALARRFAVRALAGAIDGRATIGALYGSLWRAADVRDLELATPDGRPVIRVARLRVRYALSDLARGRFLLTRVDLVRPTVVLDQGPDGRWNYERLFRLLEPTRVRRGPRPLVELRDVRIVDGTLVLRQRWRPDSALAGAARQRAVRLALADTTREVVADGGGHQRVRRVHAVNADLRRLRASHPDSSGVAVSVRSLAARLTDPAIEIVDAEGVLALHGDSARLDRGRVTLPGTRAAVSGRVRWRAGAPAYEIAVDARRFSFRDLAGFGVALPRAGGGRGTFRAGVSEDGSGAFELREVEIATGRSVVAGSFRAAVGRAGLRIGAMDLRLGPLDVADFRPFVASMPARGLVRGQIRGRGALDDLSVTAALAFTDEALPDRPTSRVAGQGRLAVLGASKLVFHEFALARADLDLGTVHRFAPAVSLPGRLLATGRLHGAWTDATFEGELSHIMASSPASRVRGTAHLVLSDTVRVNADLVADSLSFDLLGRSYPAIPLRGMAAGRVRVEGPLSSLSFEAMLSGPSGAARARGTVDVSDSVVRVRAEGAFERVDLQRQVAAAPPTGLGGTWGLDLAVPRSDTAAPVTGSVRLALGRSRVAGVALERAGLAITLTPDRVVVDTVYVEQAGASVAAAGALGRAGGLPGRIGFSVSADTLATFVPLARWTRAAAEDIGHGDAAFDGSGRVTGQVLGTTDAWRVEGAADMGRFRNGSFDARQVRLSGYLARAAGAGGLDLDVVAAATALTAFGVRYGPVEASAAGPIDSLGVGLTARMPLGSAHARALLRRGPDALTVRLDSLVIALPSGRWRLVGPSRGTLGTEALALDSAEIRAERGGGRLRAAGRLPRGGTGDFGLVVDSVPVVDAYALTGRDTVGVGGSVDLALRVLGPAAEPAMEIRFALLDGRFGDFRAPRLEALARYGDRRLTFKGGLWRERERVVELTGSLPLDLALTGVARRRLPDSLVLRARSDSVDLAVVDALTGLVTNVAGQLSADVGVGGSWDRPRLSGSLEVQGGAATVPALGVRYRGIDARFDLDGDLLSVTRARLRSRGTLDLSGAVRFESLTRPTLELGFDARGFEAFDLRDFGGVTASGALSLRGPALGATLRGRLLVDAGYLAFADLVEKRVVNLDDPEFHAIVDSNLARASELGPSVPSVFLDRLLVEDLGVEMGPDVWLRSHEANIQLAGEFRVSKAVEEGLSRYRLDGALRAARGTYRLVVGPTSREFRVMRGSMRFFGTPDLDPELDIVAEHVVRTARAGQLVVRALIGGTLLVPRLALESDQRPPLAETEIVSYLIFGRPASDLAPSGSGARSEQAILANAAASLAAGELEQTLVADLGLPLDYLAIRPGAGTAGDLLGVGSTRVEAGAQIGERTFLVLNAGLCEVRRGSTSQLLGASVEYRLSRRVNLEASVEPLVRECRAGGATASQTSRYQVGFDLSWQSGDR